MLYNLVRLPSSGPGKRWSPFQHAWDRAEFLLFLKWLNACCGIRDASVRPQDICGIWIQHECFGRYTKTLLFGSCFPLISSPLNVFNSDLWCNADFTGSLLMYIKCFQEKIFAHAKSRYPHIHIVLHGFSTVCRILLTISARLKVNCFCCGHWIFFSIVNNQLATSIDVLSTNINSVLFWKVFMVFVSTVQCSTTAYFRAYFSSLLSCCICKLHSFDRFTFTHIFLPSLLVAMSFFLLL